MDQEQSIAVALLKNIEELHSIPQVANRLLELTRFDDYDMREVAACLAQDPALAAKILRIANSAQFALHRPVTSIQQAAGLLGRRSLRLAALAFGLIGSLGDGLAKQVVDRYWRRAVTMAIAAKQLASLAGGSQPHDCYTAALLADVGVLALGQTFGDEYFRMHDEHCHDERLVAEERRRFGCGHPAVSAGLLAHWELPADLVAAAGRHHALNSGGIGMLAVV